VDEKVIKELAKKFYRLIYRVGCSLKAAEAEDCGETLAISFFFDGKCKELVVDEEEAERVVNEVADGWALYAVEKRGDSVKFVLKRKKACKLDKVTLDESEMELPKVDDGEKLKKLIEKFDKLAIVVGKKGCDAYEKVFPDVLSSAIAIALDPVPIFVVEPEGADDERFKWFIEKYEVKSCPTVLRIERGEVVDRFEGVLGDSEEDLKKSIKRLRNLLEE